MKFGSSCSNKYRNLPPKHIGVRAFVVVSTYAFNLILSFLRQIIAHRTEERQSYDRYSGSERLNGPLQMLQ